MHQSCRVIEELTVRLLALLMAITVFFSSSAGFYAYAESSGDAYALEEVLPVPEEIAPVPVDSGEPDAHVITVSKFDIEILDGYTRIAENGDYVWDANTSADGHMFMFNILFQTSGNGYIQPKEVKITIPGSVLKNKDGNFADLCEMSVPHIDLITDEVKDMTDWAYYEDEFGNLVITNVRSIPAGQACQFNVGYKTTEETFYYRDLESSSDMYADLDFDVKGSETEQYSRRLHVAIDTSVQITNTNKKKPVELYKNWDSLWGEAPADAEEYYYLIWEIETLVDQKSTQYYDFSLKDTEFKVLMPDSLSDTKLKIIGYNYSGNGNTYALLPDQVENQTVFGTRYDLVLTAIPKALYDDLHQDEEIILENTIEATVHPIDGQDADSSAAAKQTYPLKKPKFSSPIASYKIDKKGDRDNYQLDLFTDPTFPEKDLATYDYTITASGHTYAYTYDGSDPDDYQNYGKKKLHYVLTDEKVSLEGYIGDIRKSEQYILQKGDYYFTSVGFAYDMHLVSRNGGNQEFNEEIQDFCLTKPDASSGIYFYVYGEFNGSYQKIATVGTYGNSAVLYEDGMNSYAVIDNDSTGFTVSFTGEQLCTGYKIISSDDCYYHTTFTAKPSIQLVKSNEALQNWITPDQGDKVTKLLVTNTANMKIFPENNAETPFFDADASGTDTQTESTRESSILKTITGATNNTLYKRYEIAWKIEISEYVVVSSTGASNVPVIQYGGDFFDLLPRGSSVDMSTIQVYKENHEPVEFTAKTLPGMHNRVLLRVSVAADQPGERYILNFTSYHSWEDIAAFGSNIQNPAAYITGNADLADTRGNYNRGGISGDSVELMINSINSVGEYDTIVAEPGNPMYNRTIFNYEPFDIRAAVMADVGVNKTVKNAKEGSYTIKTVIDESEGRYSYRLRLENSRSTKSINNVLVDFLEDFESDQQKIKSSWQGTLRSIDVSNLLSKNVIPRVYYSTEEFRIDESDVWHVDENGMKIKLVESSANASSDQMGIRDFLPDPLYDGNAYWKVIPEDLLVNGIYVLKDENGQNVSGIDLRAVTAIVIDFTYADRTAFKDSQVEIPDVDADNAEAKITQENKYIMGLGEAAYVIVNMDNSEVERLKPKEPDDQDDKYKDYLNQYNAYNDVFSATSIFNSGYVSSSAQDHWLEQNYTTVSYRVRNNFYLKKVNANHPEETLSGITFNLTGVSWYNTKININLTTTSNGLLEFEDLEAGIYTLTEIDCGKDWQIDRTEYTVTVDAHGVTVNPDLHLIGSADHSIRDNPFILTNKPRIHMDIEFDKILYANGKATSVSVEGAMFKLSGTSDYGNEIVKIAVSDNDGRVWIEDVEQGTYELREIEAPDGYALSNIPYIVRVDANGNWEIRSDDEHAMLNSDSTYHYTIGNEKYQEFYLQKQSTEAVGEDRDVYLLDGAVFNLSGTTDDGKVVNMDVVTKYSSLYGNAIAHFGNLERGTYYLMEVTPPTYTYTDQDGEEISQKFYLDTTIYTVKVTESGVTITDPDNHPLHHVTVNNEPINDLYEFKNTPVGGQVIIRKLWMDRYEDPADRAAAVTTPDIVISREPPEPFENVYAVFDYAYNGGRLGKFGSSINNHKDLKHFQRYTGAVTILEDDQLWIDGTQINAEIISTDDSEIIYGWVDAAADNTYYWYTEAIGAKLLDARDLFSTIGIIDADFSGVDFSEAKTFEYMFNGSPELRSVTNLTRPASAKTTPSAYQMFNQCKHLGEDTGELDLREFDTTGFNNMAEMFHDAFKNGSVTIEWGAGLHTESVTTFFKMFNACTALVEINADYPMDASSVTAGNGLEWIFGDNQKLRSVPALIRNKPENPVSVSMENIFYNCRVLQKIELDDFNTAGVSTMYRAFSYCQAITSLDLRSFDTSNVTNMYSLFAQCTALKSINLSSFNTSKVTNMSYMFDNCKSLTELDISSFTMEKLTSVNIMFYNCNQLAVIYANELFDLSALPESANSSVFGVSTGSSIALTGQNGTKWSSSKVSCKYGHIDGGITNPGYFTKKANNRLTLSWNNTSRRSYADDPEKKPDNPDYRSSSNHYPVDLCGEDHFFIVRTKAEAEALKDDYPTIYELVKDIQDNEWIYVFDDIVGEGFHVWEENIPKGYESNYDNFLDEHGSHRITNVTDGVATITNKLKAYKMGTLAISKRILNTDGTDITDEFTTKYIFEIELSNMKIPSPQTLTAVYCQTTDEARTETEQSVLFVDGKATVEIQSGCTLKFKDLPEETEYIIREQDDPDVITTGIIVNDEEAVISEKQIEGQIKADTDISVEYRNTIEADLRPKGEFMLKKLVENENDVSDANTEYTFTIEFKDLVKNTEYAVYRGEEIIKTFRSGSDQTATVVVYLKAEDILSFKGIPEGAGYRITEASSGAYISSYVIDTRESNVNTAAGTELTTQWQTMNPDNPSTVTFTNKIVKVQSLSVVKTVTGGSSESLNEEKYKFIAQFSNLGAKYQLIAAGQGTFQADESGNLKLEFYLKAGESYNFTNIPAGAVYRIYEEYEGQLIPCHEITRKDEATGEIQHIYPVPSANSGSRMTSAVESAQGELDKAQTVYATAESLLSYDKKTLDAEILKIIDLLTDVQKSEYADDIQMFTADNYMQHNQEYLDAQWMIFSLIATLDADLSAFHAAESELETTAEEYRTASKALEAAQNALIAARGASYTEGSVELNQDTTIDFLNSYPFSLTIRKKVTGMFGELQRDFYFKIIFQYNGKPFSGSYDAQLSGEARITDSQYQVIGENFRFSDDGAVYFILKDSDTITFENLPYGTTYEITEEETKDYEVIVEGKVLENRTVNGTIEENLSIEYENHWNGSVPDLPGTGAGIGKRLIYLTGFVMLTEGIIGAVWLYKRKRHPS